MSKEGKNEGEAPRVPDNLEIVDPLGEIRNYARELWQKDGEPAGRDWRHYWAQAETVILGGVSSGEPSDRERLPSVEPKSVAELPPHLLVMYQQHGSLLLSIVVGAFRRELTRQEALSLAHILETHRIYLTEERELPPATRTEIAEILAEVVKEYSSEFLNRHNTSDLRTIPIAERQQYWQKVLDDLAADDEALNYLERTSILRFLNELVNEPRVVRLEFEAEPPELA